MLVIWIVGIFFTQRGKKYWSDARVLMDVCCLAGGLHKPLLNTVDSQQRKKNIDPCDIFVITRAYC